MAGWVQEKLYWNAKKNSSPPELRRSSNDLHLHLKRNWGSNCGVTISGLIRTALEFAIFMQFQGSIGKRFGYFFGNWHSNCPQFAIGLMLQLIFAKFQRHSRWFIRVYLGGDFIERIEGIDCRKDLSFIYFGPPEEIRFKQCPETTNKSWNNWFKTPFAYNFL